MKIVICGLFFLSLAAPAAAQGIDMGGTPAVFQQPVKQIDLGGTPAMFMRPNVIVVQPQVPNWPQPYPYVYPNVPGFPQPAPLPPYPVVVVPPRR